MKAIGWKHIILGTILYLSIYVIFVQESWIQDTMTKERQANQEVLGADRAMAAEIRATNLFNKLFVNSGLMGKSFSLFIPTGHEQANSQGLEDLGFDIFLWMEKRIRAAWTLIYQVMLRFFMTIAWWPFMILATVPAIYDALISRKIKSTTFGITSPHIQGLAVRAIPVVVIGYVLVMVSPLFIHPGWVPALVMFSALAMWLGISQFVKRG